MNTPTHALLNWAIAKSLPVSSFPASAVLLGSIAPDIPLYCLTIGTGIYLRFAQGMEPDRIGRLMFGTLFFKDPVWISLHNVLHSPLVLIASLAAIYFFTGGEHFLQSWWTWFFASCLL